MQIKERLTDTKHMIQRVYEQSIEGSSDPGIPQEDLLKIMRVLEEGDETAINELLESEKIRRELSDCLSRGDLLDYVLDVWTPWWQPETHPATSTEMNESDLGIPLDDRLLMIPRLNSLHPDPSKLPDLRYNLLDIIHAICWTLRLYHGCSNAMECSIDAAETLYRASFVISEDARWQNLPEVLSSCTMRSTRSRQNGGCNTSSLQLINDMIQITESNRYIAKALLEALDILRSATAAAKRDNDTESFARLRKCRKKIEFFLSWCRESSNMELLTQLPKRIEMWSTEWELLSTNNDDKESILGGFRISSSSSRTNLPATSRPLDPLLIEEVSSGKK
jgi:hypothetical protein